MASCLALRPGVAQEAVHVGVGPLTGLRPPEAGSQHPVDLGALGRPVAHDGRGQGNGCRQGFGPKDGGGHSQTASTATPLAWGLYR